MCVVAAVLVTNLSSAIIIPVTLPFLLGAQAHVRISVWEVLEPVIIVMFVPLILAFQFLTTGKALPFDSFDQLHAAMVAEYPQFGRDGLIDLPWAPPALESVLGHADAQLRRAKSEEIRLR